MNNIYQTGQTINTQQGQSTSPNTPATKTGIVFDKKQGFIFQPNMSTYTQPVIKEELTEEEEEKFYKKVFKTSLI
jgi:hypothetical protein